MTWYSTLPTQQLNDPPISGNEVLNVLDVISSSEVSNQIIADIKELNSVLGHHVLSADNPAVRTEFAGAYNIRVEDIPIFKIPENSVSWLRSKLSDTIDDAFHVSRKRGWTISLWFFIKYRHQDYLISLR